jgi:hypothetical protein
MNRYITAFLLLISTSVSADNSSLNLSVPAAPGSYQSDRIRSGDLDCSNAIGGSTNLEFGVTGIIGADRDPLSPTFGDRTKDVGVYARIIVPLDGPKERINCNTLYQLEIQKKRMEVEKLQQELNQLRALQFEK